jgi:hypothetical protein
MRERNNCGKLGCTGDIAATTKARRQADVEVDQRRLIKGEVEVQ